MSGAGAGPVGSGGGTVFVVMVYFPVRFIALPIHLTLYLDWHEETEETEELRGQWVRGDQVIIFGLARGNGGNREHIGSVFRGPRPRISPSASPKLAALHFLHQRAYA